MGPSHDVSPDLMVSFGSGLDISPLGTNPGHTWMEGMAGYLAKEKRTPPPYWALSLRKDGGSLLHHDFGPTWCSPLFWNDDSSLESCFLYQALTSA